MPERDFIIFINEMTRLFVYFNYNKTELLNFVVKLEIYFMNKWTEIERYDCYHSVVHKDILNKKGEKIRTVSYPLVDQKSGVNFAINDFRENHEIYIWRFLNEKQ